MRHTIGVYGLRNLRPVGLKGELLVEPVENACVLLGSPQKKSAIGGKKVLLSGGLAVQSLHNGFYG